MSAVRLPACAEASAGRRRISDFSPFDRLRAKCVRTILRIQMNALLLAVVAVILGGRESFAYPLIGGLLPVVQRGRAGERRIRERTRISHKKTHQKRFLSFFPHVLPKILLTAVFPWHMLPTLVLLQSAVNRTWHTLPYGGLAVEPFTLRG